MLYDDRIESVAHRHIAGIALVATALLTLGACSEGTSPNQTALGTTVTVGGGTARTYVETTGQGEPVEIGVMLSESALSGLPAAGTVYLLPLPAGSVVAPYKHVTLNWNPGGHPPPGVFTVPHFDVHFYTITEAERAAISPADPQFGAKSAVNPPADLVPAGYVRDPGAVPDMGTHWSDPSAPEFNGQPFTRTFIYGSWNGAFTFYEPMVTTAFLATKPPITSATLKLPARYAPPGRYPTTYTVGYDATGKQYVIAIGNLVPRS
ncbi:MAG TPA: DUF5602 domain-containing protein [Gemmatimonadaceae bacterium]|nr:DUF5602 domain-containing protein [Gemmatimonadaceae bacterium]